MQNKELKVTIGIPTYVGGPSLVKAVQSLLASEGVSDFRLIVCVDGKKLEPEIKSALETDARVQVIENLERGGQVARLRQIMKMSFDQDIVILTQDDLLFDKNAVAEIVKSFQSDDSITMVTASAKPLRSKTWFERVVNAGFWMVDIIEKKWNDGDNFLRASGRCIAFTGKMAQHIYEEIQEEVINCDAHFYFINKKYDGHFTRNDDAIYYFRSPSTLADHLKQSKKYQNVSVEMLKYRGIDIDREYPIPFDVKLRALLQSFLWHPILIAAYFVVTIYTRMHQDSTFKKATRFWDTDASTKEI